VLVGYVTMTYNTQYFFHQNRFGTATKKNEIPWNGPYLIGFSFYFKVVFLFYKKCVSKYLII
jgi:hypothetical protein